MDRVPLYSRLSPHKIVADVVGGSVSHRLTLPESDLDTYVSIIPVPFDLHHVREFWEAENVNVYPLAYQIMGAVCGDIYRLEPFFAPPRCILYETEIWLEIKSKRELLFSRDLANSAHWAQRKMLKSQNPVEAKKFGQHAVRVARMMQEIIERREMIVDRVNDASFLIWLRDASTPLSEVILAVQIEISRMESRLRACKWLPDQVDGGIVEAIFERIESAAA
jgi:hypothetical protein